MHMLQEIKWTMMDYCNSQAVSSNDLLSKLVLGNGKYLKYPCADDFLANNVVAFPKVALSSILRLCSVHRWWSAGATSPCFDWGAGTSRIYSKNTDLTIKRGGIMRIQWEYGNQSHMEICMPNHAQLYCSMYT